MNPPNKPEARDLQDAKSLLARCSDFLNAYSNARISDDMITFEKARELQKEISSFITEHNEPR